MAAASAPARPVEAGKHDSGVVDLNTIKSTATAEQKAAAEKAKPASEGIFEDDEKKEKKAVAAVVPISAAKGSAESPKKKGSNGVVVGGLIALVGIAAAVAITKMNKPAPPPPAPVAAEVKPAGNDTKTETAAQPATSGAPVAQATSEPAAEEKTPEEKAKVASAPQSGSGAAAEKAAAPTTSAEPAPEKAPSDAEKTASTATPSTSSKPGDLKGAMAQAVGADGTPKNASADDPERIPAAGPRNQNIPEKPSQGSVTAAIGSVMGGAKSCVAGADDVSRAQITFGSNGSVKSVSVTGWAASHSATGCIKAALQSANVGPFSSSTFAVGVTIRP